MSSVRSFWGVLGGHPLIFDEHVSSIQDRFYSVLGTPIDRIDFCACHHEQVGTFNLVSLLCERARFVSPKPKARFEVFPGFTVGHRSILRHFKQLVPVSRPVSFPGRLNSIYGRSVASKGISSAAEARNENRTVDILLRVFFGAGNVL